MIIEKTEGGAVVHVGSPVEIKQSELAALGECAHQMTDAYEQQRTGGFLVYMQAHKASLNVIQMIMRRSHAN